MSAGFFALVVFALFALAVLRVSVRNSRRSAAALQTMLDRSDGHLDPAVFATAQGVIEDHLVTARDGAVVSLDYGDLGRLNVVRVRPPTGTAGYRLDWHRRSGSPRLDARLAEHAGDAVHDKEDMVVISVEDDYFRLDRVLEDIFLPIDDDEMKLTWHAPPHAKTEESET